MLFCPSKTVLGHRAGFRAGIFCFCSAPVTASKTLYRFHGKNHFMFAAVNMTWNSVTYQSKVECNLCIFNFKRLDFCRLHEFSERFK